MVVRGKGEVVVVILNDRDRCSRSNEDGAGGGEGH